MAIAVKALPFTFVAHVLGLAALIMVLIWLLAFRGGMAFESSDKSLIFNVSSYPLLLLPLLLLSIESLY